MSWTVPTPSLRVIASAHLNTASRPASHLQTCWVLAGAPKETQWCRRARRCQHDASAQAPFSPATVTANSATGSIMKQLSRCSRELSWPTPLNSLHDTRGYLPGCNSWTSAECITIKHFETIIRSLCCPVQQFKKHFTLYSKYPYSVSCMQSKCRLLWTDVNPPKLNNTLSIYKWLNFY